MKSFLDAWLPNRYGLDLYFADRREGDPVKFRNERGMIAFFTKHQDREQFLLWKGDKFCWKQNIMTGVEFLADGGLVFSTTLASNSQVEHECLEEMKELLDSPYGVLQYQDYPAYGSSEEFIAEAKIYPWTHDEEWVMFAYSRRKKP